MLGSVTTGMGSELGFIVLVMFAAFWLLIALGGVLIVLGKWGWSLHKHHDHSQGPFKHPQPPFDAHLSH